MGELQFFLSLLPRARAVMIWGGCDVTLELPVTADDLTWQVSKQQEEAELCKWAEFPPTKNDESEVTRGN